MRKPLLRVVASWATAIALGLLLLSCAGAPAGRPEEDALASLDPQALGYIRLSGSAIAALAPALLSAATGAEGEGSAAARAATVSANAASAAEFARRTRVLCLAFLARGLSEASTTGLPPLELAAAGEFSRFEMGFALGGSRGWKPTPEGWRNATLGVSLAVPRQGLVLATTGDLSVLVERPARGGSPFPADIAALPWPDILLWLPDPLGRLLPGIGLPDEVRADISLPLEGILVRGQFIAPVPIPATGTTGSRAGTSKVAPDQRSSLTILLRMKDEEASRIYLPAARFLWVLLSRGPLAEVAEGSTVTFERRGGDIAIAGLEASASSLARLLTVLSPRRAPE